MNNRKELLDDVINKILVIEKEQISATKPKLLNQVIEQIIKVIDEVENDVN